MKRIFKGKIPRPTRVYETENGYLVISRLRYDVTTKLQKLILSIIFVFFGLLTYSAMFQFEILIGSIMICAGSLWIMRKMPLTTKFKFNKLNKTVKFNMGLLDKHSYQIDESSVFLFDNTDSIEYIYGLNGSVFGYGLRFSPDPKKNWDQNHVASLVAVLNEITKMTLGEKDKPKGFDDFIQAGGTSSNPME